MCWEIRVVFHTALCAPLQLRSTRKHAHTHAKHTHTHIEACRSIGALIGRIAKVASGRLSSGGWHLAACRLAVGIWPVVVAAARAQSHRSAARERKRNESVLSVVVLDGDRGRIVLMFPVIRLHFAANWWPTVSRVPTATTMNAHMVARTHMHTGTHNRAFVVSLVCCVRVPRAHKNI